MTPNPTGTGAVIVGTSKGNLGGTSSTDIGSRDISASLPFSTDATDQLPLTLDSNAPILGEDWVLTTTNHEPIAPAGATFFGDQQVNPGLDLTFIGAPDCFAYTNANLGGLTYLVSSGTGQIIITIPNTPALAGQQFSAQSVSFTTNNLAGLNFSNGVLGTIGQ
jgi:hypothetical protein